jgi:hypothetical protein
MTPYEKDESHWLFKLSPDEWIRAAMTELRRAEESYKQRDAKAGLAGCRRAAGMALNAALIVRPRESWGRTYLEHVTAVAQEEEAPEAVKRACQLLLDTKPPGSGLISLRRSSVDLSLVEAARDVMAHAYAVYKRYEEKHHEKPDEEGE